MIELLNNLLVLCVLGVFLVAFTLPLVLWVVMANEFLNGLSSKVLKRLELILIVLGLTLLINIL